MTLFLFVVGCGDGANSNAVVNSSNEDTIQNSTTDNQVEHNESSDSSSATKTYSLKRIPTIKESAIPKQLLRGNRLSKQVESKQYREIGEVSVGFTRLHEVSQFFYQKQLMMNIDLGYIDSIFDQIDSYCKDKEKCTIPANKITFRYTKELYNRDNKLIKEYAAKTNDTTLFQADLMDLKKNIGTESKLGAIEFIRNFNGKYQYILKTQKITRSDTAIDLEVRWSDDNSSFLVQESLSYFDLNSKAFEPNSVIVYKYDSINGTKIHNFSQYDHFLEKLNKVVEFSEKEDGTYSFISDDVSYTANLTFHGEGSLSSSGGDITFSVEGYYLHETFDENGIIQSSIKCLNPNTDKNDIKEEDYCEIQDPKIIKKYLTSHIFTLGEPFTNVDDFTPTSAPELHSFVKFDTNNSMKAVVNCITYRAKYSIGEYKITFDNISREVDPNLQCLYPYAADSFEYMLQNGLFYGDTINDTNFKKSHFDMAFGLWPNFDSHDRNSFDFREFYNKLYAKEYVDAPLIDAVFHIVSAYNFSSNDGKLYLISQEPKIYVENKKITIDILDARFTANILVADPTHIQFDNIQREDKENVQYPENSSCIITFENNCFEDPMTGNQYSDRNFANIIEEFLNEMIEVSAFSTDYRQIRLKGSKLTFIAEVF